MTAISHVAPIKHLYGRELYAAMKADFEYGLIVWTMQRYNKAMSKDEAERLLDAFLQWISLAPLNTKDRFVTMFQTPVEEAFHCFVLNTRLYKAFCEQFLPFFFHHDPIVSESVENVHAWAEYTVKLMEAEFGDDLNPELKVWRQQFDAGTYKIACAGPGGSC